MNNYDRLARSIEILEAGRAFPCDESVPDIYGELHDWELRSEGLCDRREETALEVDPKRVARLVREHYIEQEKAAVEMAARKSELMESAVRAGQLAAERTVAEQKKWRQDNKISEWSPSPFSTGFQDIPDFAAQYARIMGESPVPQCLFLPIESIIMRCLCAGDRLAFRSGRWNLVVSDYTRLTEIRFETAVLLVDFCEMARDLALQTCVAQVARTHPEMVVSE